MTDETKDLIKKQIQKKYGDIIRSGADVFEEIKDLQVIPISPALDYALGGGIREGSWVKLTGDPKTGKTTTALQFAANCQREEYGSRPIYYVNVEGRLNRNNLEGVRGLNLDNIQVIESPDQPLSAEKYLGTVKEIVNAVPNCVIILDSVSSLIAQRDLDDEVRGDYRPGLQKILSDFCKKMGGTVRHQRAIIIMVTHFISNTSGFSRKTKVSDGGVKIDYQADTKLEIKYIQAWKEKIDGQEKQIGQVIHWSVVTSPLSGFPGAEAVSYLRYGKGIDEMQELIQQAIDFALIDVSGAWYSCDFAIDGKESMTDFLTEHNIDIEDEKSIEKFFKFQGQVKLKQFLSDNPKVFKLLKNTVREILV
jgi:recombination protein RecA